MERIEELKEKTLDIYSSDGALSAVRYLKTHSGLSLNDAKNLFDEWRDTSPRKLSYSELEAKNKKLSEALQKMCEWHEKQATWDKGDNGYYAAKALLKEQ